MKRGLLITFEGLDGAGKSTLIRALSSRLKKAGRSVVVTREPGGSPLSEKIRKIIIENEMTAETELLLYEASRSEHVRKTIRPALKKGKIVLCDRYADSSIAYQGVARGLGIKRVVELNRFATDGLEADLTILLDIAPQLGPRKARVKTRFEKQGLVFYQKVRRGFAKARSRRPRKWISLKAQKDSPRKMADEVMKALKL